MIQNIRNIQVFKADELSNEDYHAHEYISGSSLVEIHSECIAQWKFGEKKETPPLRFGIASHAALLEPEKFDAEFVCDINASEGKVKKADIPSKGWLKVEPKKESSLITSDAELKAWLKHRGIKYKSTTPFSELVQLAYAGGEEPKILKLDSMILESNAVRDGKTIVKYDDYEMIMQMRRVVFADQAIAAMLVNARVEMSIICDIKINGVWIGIKIRPDIITENFEVPDYKTTASMNPEKFGRDAHDKGYWLKQAFIHDVLQAVYKREAKMGLLAQCKSAPYIHQLYWMTEEQLEVGRDQYESALMDYYRSKESGIYPAYFDGATMLPTPAYLAKRYEFEQDDDIEIKFED